MNELELEGNKFIAFLQKASFVTQSFELNHEEGLTWNKKVNVKIKRKIGETNEIKSVMKRKAN